MSTFDDPEILRSVLEELPTGVYLVGRDGKILFWNHGAERITGHLRQDVVGHLCREDFLGETEGNAEQVSATAAALEAVLKDGKATESQVSFRHKSGYLVPVRLRAVAMRDSHGAIIGAAESFDEVVDLGEWNRRHNKLAEYGCLDAASGVLTHKVTEARLRECLATYADQPVPFCIVCIAFDHLEEVKGRYGAGALAAVLRVAGQSLENSLRPTDYLGRWQENEFLAIVLECNETEIPRVGERLRKTIASAKITWWGDSLPVTIAMGATAAKAEDTVAEIMRRAEEALRESIALGGNQMVVLE
ncbi:MAG TPA: diguanylate cyclase [Candidatus Cybelea sp.]|nr:diguanylate cyclase [Candidatus Cybelea sp.]